MPRNNRLDFGDDPDYDPDYDPDLDYTDVCKASTRGVSRAEDQIFPLNSGDDPDYDSDYNK